MDAIRAGRVADTIVSFVPTRAHMESPSLMEISMSDNLLVSARQAAAFIAANGRITTPLLPLNRYVDILITAMEIFSVLSRSATVGEAYLGLKRQPLSRVQRVVTVMEAVVLPYLTSLPDDELTENQRKILSTYKALKALFAIMYLTSFSAYSNPIHYIFGIKVGRNLEPPSPAPRTFRERLQRVPSMIVWGVVYGVQLAQWYYSHQEVLQNRRFGRRRKIGPPELEGPALVDPRLCPACRRPRTNPTALLADGTVYCYSCLVGKLGVSPQLTRRLVT